MTQRAPAPGLLPLVLAAAAAALYLLAATSRDFWAPDEPDFAEAVREMNDRRDWLVPFQNGVPYSEKPILFYWAVAATTVLTRGDVAPWSTRLVSVVSGAFLVWAASAFALWRGGRREALLAGAATATGPLLFWQGQFLQIDAFFSALLLSALLCQVLVEEDPVRAPRWRLLFQVLLPVAVLTKGPLALVLTGLFALVRAGLSRSTRPITALGPGRGAAIFVVLVVPWYVLAARAGGPEYARDLVIRQNWTRFTEAFDHVQPWWFYLEAMWGDFSPWTLPALAAPFVLARRRVFAERRELALAAQAAASLFLFLSASQSKQGKYLLAVYPIAAVLMAAAVLTIEARRDFGTRLLRALRGYTAFAAVLLLLGAAALWPVVRARRPDFTPLVPAVALPMAAGAAATLAALSRWKREALPGMLALAGTLALTEASASAAVFPAIDPLKTGRSFYERIRPVVGAPDVPLGYFGPTYRCTPILVLKRKTAHLRTEADLVSWVKSHPGGYVLADLSESRHWTAPALRSLSVVDRGPVGGDEARLLRAP